MPIINRTINRYHFTANWGGDRVEFLEISGLDISIDVVTTRNGNSPDNAEVKLPGITKYSEVTLKRNINIGDFDFYNWIRTSNFGKVERRDVTIQLLNAEHNPVMTWVLRNAFPSKYIGPVLLSGDSNLATESLVISHNGLEILK